MILQNFSFLRPYWLLAFLPLIYLSFRLLKESKTLNAWSEVIDKHLLKHLIKKNKIKGQKIIPMCLSIFGALLIFILAGPSFKKINTPLFLKQDALVIAVDVSEKMLATDISPSRMQRAIFKLKELLRLRKEGQTGLVVFSGDAFVASPLSNDSKTLAAMVDEINPQIVPIGGQNISNALNTSAQLIKKAGSAKGEILLLTAGPASKADIDTALKLAKEGISTNVLALATTQGAPIFSSQPYANSEINLSKLDKKSLSQLAKKGHGQFIISSANNQDIKALLNPNKGEIKANDKTDFNINKKADNGRLFILLLLPFALYAFREGFVEKI